MKEKILFSDNFKTDVNTLKSDLEELRNDWNSWNKAGGTFRITLTNVTERLYDLIGRVSDDYVEKINLQVYTLHIEKFWNLDKKRKIGDEYISNGSLVQDIFSDVDGFIRKVDMREKYKDVDYEKSIQSRLSHRKLKDWKKLFDGLLSLGLSEDSENFLTAFFSDIEEEKDEMLAKKNYEEFCKEIESFVYMKNCVDVESLDHYLSTQFKIKVRIESGIAISTVEQNIIDLLREKEKLSTDEITKLLKLKSDATSRYHLRILEERDIVSFTLKGRKKVWSLVE